MFSDFKNNTHSKWCIYSIYIKIFCILALGTLNLVYFQLCEKFSVKDFSYLEEVMSQNV